MLKKSIIGAMAIITLSSIAAFAAGSSATFTKSGQHGGQKGLEAAPHRLKVTSHTGTSSYTVDMKEKVNLGWDPQVATVSGNGIGTQYSSTRTTKHSTYYMECAKISGSTNKKVEAWIIH